MTDKINSLADAERAQKQLTERIGRLPGIRGIGVTHDARGSARVRVNVDPELQASVRARIPSELDGVSVELRKVGVFRSFAGNR